jgi:hypothetical protein
METVRNTKKSGTRISRAPGFSWAEEVSGALFLVSTGELC